MEDFVHLHVHTQYSILDGQSKIPHLVDKAIKDGMKGMAVTDHGVMFGIKELTDYCAKVNKDRKKEGLEPFKPIIGCEMYVARRRKEDREKDKGDMSGYHLIVLAKNYNGYKNLIQLVSNAWVDGYYMRPRTDRADLEKYHEDLIVCSACIAGEVPSKILHGDIEGAREACEWYHNLFGDDYYLELQRHEVKEPLPFLANREAFQLQQKANKVLIEMAREYGIKLVCTNDCHFEDKETAEAHDHLLCIATGKDLDDPNRMRYSKQEWFKTRQEMNDVFSDIPEALSNTLEVLDKVEIYSIDHGPIMPFFPIPESFGTEEQLRQKVSEEDLYKEFTSDENGENQLPPEEGQKVIDRLGGYDKIYRIKFEAEYLRHLAYEGARQLYGDPLPANVDEHVNFELHVMKTMGFPGYFLIVQDFINTARNKLGVSVGPGRGSAAGSAAAYCLGITDIDPIKYDLLFERFLNPDRISLPDIDVDFDDDGRYEVLKYVTEKYGAEKVAHIITYQTMATKSAIKDMAKIMEVPLAESNRLARLIPDKLPEVDGKSVKVNFKNCMKYVKELAAEAESPNPNIREVIKYAPQLEGNVRTTGVHACGVIICRDDITDWVPVMMGEDADGSKVISTQYEGSVIEQTGLIKMDFLGLKTLSIIKEVLANIRKSRGIEIDIDHIPLDDPATFKLYCDGNTTATFQFESVGMQRSLRELQPSKFEDLIAMNALYRPGPMDYIPDFIARRHGRQPIVYDIPVMEKYLKDTYGITVYQEQVMLLSRLLANFTRGESDALRKAMGKKKKAIVDAMKPKFIEGGKSNGYDPKVLEKIWADWEKFASYAFNKSHATCYSWVAYQTAYLKANYPAEYMAGVLSCNLASSDKLKKFMDECRNMGVVVKGPDINESFEKFSVTTGGEVRFGLGGIRGVGSGAVNAIISEREANGPFRDIYDFVERVNLSACNRATIESLALAGCFDCFEDVCREMFVHEMFDTTYSDMLVKYGQRFQADRNSVQASLFGDLEPIETNKPPYPQVERWSDLKRLEEEKRLVSIYLSAHPLDKYYMEVTYGCNTPCSEFQDRQPTRPEEIRGDLTMGGLVTAFTTKISRKGTPYGILEIEDFSGKTELRLFGKSYEQFSGALVPGAAVFMRISFAPDRFKPGDVRMNIAEISPLADKVGRIANELTVFIDSNISDSGLGLAFKEFELQPKEKGGGTLNLIVNFADAKVPQSISVRSRKRYRICKELMDSINGVSGILQVKVS